MTDSPDTTVTTPVPLAESPFAPLLRAAVIPSAVCGVITAIVLWIVRGTAGGLSGLFGAALALAFFTSGLLVLMRLRNLDPALLMAAGLAVFFGQVLILGLILAAAVQIKSLDGPATAIAVVVVVIAWQVFQVIGFRRSRQPIYDPVISDTVGTGRNEPS